MQRYQKVFGQISGAEIGNQNDCETTEEADEIKYENGRGVSEERWEKEAELVGKAVFRGGARVEETKKSLNLN